MVDTRVSPLRQRMIEDMTMRNFAPRTQEGYIRAVRAFAGFLGRSPSEASFEDVRRFQVHLVSSGTGVPTVNHALTALRKVSDIDSARMVIRIEQGKGRKDRYVMLSPHLLVLLRAWWKVARPQGWLFPGQSRVNPLTTRQLNRACHAAARIAEIDKRVSLHTLRHSFATHLLEQKVDIRVIQVLLGHKKLDTTALYTRVALKSLGEVTSPLEHLALTVTSPA